MCSFNGSKYILNQINSILIQLSKDDELIISDDCSTDDTIIIIMGINDNRVKLFKNIKNLGHVKNFENVLKKATGDFIFFSDQDDVWPPNKISTVMSIFNLKTNSNVLLIHHELLYVDDSLNPIFKPKRNLKFGLQSGKKFILNQFYSPQIFGCGCAFRKDLKKWLLPFPNITYAHDHWLAMCAPMVGNVFLSEDKLVLYRQHENNLTPKNKLSLVKKLTLRIKLFILLIISLYRFLMRSKY